MFIAINKVILLIVMMFFSVFSLGEPRTIYIDNERGNNKNTGLEKNQAYKSIRYGLKKMQPGDEMFIISNGPSKPYREKFTITLSGTGDIYSTISGDHEKGGSYIVGSIDLSAKNKSNKWRVNPDGTWSLLESPNIKSLWMASEKQWESGGVTGLEKLAKASNKNNIKAAEWYYEKKGKHLLYRPVAEQMLDKMHFEGVFHNKNITINNGNNLNLQHINIAFSTKTSVMVFGNSRNIIFRDFTLKHAANNGILFSDGGNIVIERCTMSDIGNSGIKFRGSKTNKISNTVVRDCNISHVKGNSALTYHKSSDYLDIGDNHLVENNILFSCGEEGLDITSGSGFVVRNNTTYDNYEAALVVGHKAKDIVIENHLSVYDGRKKGAIKINYSQNVQLKNSLVFSGLRYQVLLHGNDGFYSEGNRFVAGKDSRGPLVKIETSSRNNHFNNNYFSNQLQNKQQPLLLLDVALVEDKINGKKVGFPALVASDTLGAAFENNIWSVRDKKYKAFYNNTLASSFSTFEEAKGFLSKDNLTSISNINREGDVFYLSAEDRLKFGSSLPNFSKRWQQIEADLTALR